MRTAGLLGAALIVSTLALLAWALCRAVGLSSRYDEEIACPWCGVWIGTDRVARFDHLADEHPARWPGRRWQEPATRKDQP